VSASSRSASPVAHDARLDRTTERKEQVLQDAEEGPVTGPLLLPAPVLGTQLAMPAASVTPVPPRLPKNGASP
jgi:hypothetical protein